MKRVLNVLVMMYVLVLTSSSAMAQLGEKTMALVEKQVVKMKKVMELSDEQTAKLIEIRVAMFEQSRQNKTENKNDREAFDKKNTEISQNYVAHFKRICTAEQRKKWRAYRKAKVKKE